MQEVHHYARHYEMITVNCLVNQFNITSQRLTVSGHDNCYSAVYTSQTQERQRFTISEVAADWHELMIPQHIMRPCIDCANGQLDLQCS